MSLMYFYRNDPVGNLDPNRPVQKNKKRCFKCNIKLELALREIGRCRCGKDM